MKTKFQLLEEKLKAARELKAKTETDIAALEEKLQTMQNNADQIAASGDVQRYTAAKKEIEELKTLLEVKKAVLKHNVVESANNADIAEAWKEYAETSGKDIKAAIEKYKKMRSELYSQFISMVKLQNEVIKTREKCERISGKDKAFFGFSGSIPQEFFKDKDFFFKTGCCDLPKACALSCVINMASSDDSL